jgi:hypothetical protein
LCLCGFLSAEIVDRIVVTVGAGAGPRLITLSDVRDAYAVQTLLDHQPMEPLDDARIKEVAERLVDQALVLQEMESARLPPMGPEALEKRQAEIRAGLGDEAAFQRALKERGLEEARFWRIIQQQLNIMRFVELRFRPNAIEEGPDIERYYREQLVPKLRAQNAPVPELEAVRDKIAEVLAQQRINELYAAWLKELRGQATIRFR